MLETNLQTYFQPHKQKDYFYPSKHLQKLILHEDLGEEFQGYGRLRIDNTTYRGEGVMLITDTQISIEIEGHTAVWEIKKVVSYRNIEIYYGEGELGKIIVMVYNGNRVIAIGNGILFFGYS